MNYSVNNKKNTARIERQQRKLEAGFVSAQFPEVTGIVVNMIYNQRGIQKSLCRVVNFFPGSYALFRIECLNKECCDGGFDLTQVISGMVRNRREAAKGNISCEGNSASADHSTITYEVSIQYT
ncbi:MAG: hypothetical protein ACHQ0Y_12095 [Thermodesulfovibrionales bacterium]